ncbi:hypothetical protein SVI_3149 [Shewanella violacea DSS12]|uniref:Uncharacterized protein n=1 Tax=Shewanella violacea (strain JCM 10179 / CIP 106290 / LMG 19151 / DSS12) TaxID=637905 RepID=D4ZAS5_SHEVD|nr:hypothetical protein SVI_3149 [Shewanella violacea DSS12]
MTEYVNLAVISRLPCWEALGNNEVMSFYDIF